jgi:SAM-dependent methyltransferase
VNLPVKQSFLSLEEVLSGYDAVSQLYPHIPPMCIWRAWEYAAYHRYTLSEPVLDIGCGDGRFFQLAWPEIRDVVGVDADPAVAEAARRFGIYREVHVAPAHQLPVLPESFAFAFANCSLEHMDHLPEVLSSIRRSLHHGGFSLFSVVTDKFIEWATLSLLIDRIGEPERARTLQAEYEAYHHLVNPFPLEVWMEHLEKAGFEVLEHVPIVPEMTSRLFLFLDHLWHVRRLGGELGDMLHTYLATLPNFTQAFRQVLAGVLQMERDFSTGSGAILWARRSR